VSGAWTRWPAPAKLNLFLHVTARRADGYHELQTVFQLLDYGDEVAVRLRDDGVIGRVGALPGVEPDDDLVVRAARLLMRHVGTVPGADIAVDKHIPMGGGLGGGSSDAASVLVALDQLWRLELGEEVLARLGLSLGADVPVFVRGCSAWAQGVGEHLQPVRIEPCWYVVVTPAVQISTAEVFAAPALTRNTPRLTINDFLREGLAGDDRQLSTSALLERTTNDCEPVVRAMSREVAAALDWLGAKAPARMTGTGASVFASFADETRAREVVACLPARWQGFAARGLDESPLRAARAAGGSAGWRGVVGA
jgi:4-diphosphocytidyl-2-C-methyl-D-erythritol kinase